MYDVPSELFRQTVTVKSLKISDSVLSVLNCSSYLSDVVRALGVFKP
jgi:hypothetical protein